MPFDSEFEAKAKAWLAENPQGKHGHHSYSAATYGLDAAELRSRYSEYIAAFKVELK